MMSLADDLYYKEIGEQIVRHIQGGESPKEKIVCSRAVQALEEIQKTVQNMEKSDFQVIEELIYVFAKYGVDWGERHDFG